MALAAGKVVGGALYFHVSVLDLLPEVVQAVADAQKLAGVESFQDYTVIKIAHRCRRISLLNYPCFFDEAFPTLVTAWTVDLESEAVHRRDYTEHGNPPILHRKELLIKPSHPRIGEYRALTEAAEKAGLYREPHRIGFRKEWHFRLAQAGLQIEGHCLVPTASEVCASDGNHS